MMIINNLIKSVFISLTITLLTQLLLPKSNLACADDLLTNSSFEEGREPWFSLDQADKPYWNKFIISEKVVHNGKRSAYLKLRSSNYDHKLRIVGAVQEFKSLDSFPKRLSGWYRIENWVQGTAKQYLQVVVTVEGAKNIQLPDKVPVQLSYVLTGIKSKPTFFMNRKFDFTESKKLKENHWIYFNKDLHADFIKHWGVVPEPVDKIRVLFEARFDDRLPDEQQVYADVYYDDLYFGD